MTLLTSPSMMLVRLLADVLIIVLIFRSIYWSKRIARKTRIEMETMLEEKRLVTQELEVVREERELIAGLLTTIKGWTVINVESDKKRSEKVDQLQQALETTVPNKTAAKVVEKIRENKIIDDKALADSQVDAMRVPPEVLDTKKPN